MRLRRAVFSAASTAALSVLMTATGAAHDLFIVPSQFRVPSAGSPLTIGYHSGDGFPESTQVPARLRDAAIHGANGSLDVANLKTDGKRSVGTVTPTQPGHYIATTVAAANTIEMAPGEFLDYLKEEGLTHVIDARTQSGDSSKPARERYTKYAKSIFLVGAPNENYKKTLGLPIEIVPEKDPYAIKAGESLPVRVFVRGNPVAGLEIRTATSGVAGVKSSGRTDDDGRISIPMAAAGSYRLHALQMERVTDGSADWESFWATLTFEVR